MRSAIEVRLQPGAFILHPSSFILFFINLDLLDLLGFNAPTSNPVALPRRLQRCRRGVHHSDSPGAPAKNCSFWSDQVGFAWICFDPRTGPIQSALPRRLQGCHRGVHSLRFTRRSSQKLLVLVGSGRILPGFAWIDIPAPMQQSALPRQGIHPLHPMKDSPPSYFIIQPSSFHP